MDFNKVYKQENGVSVRIAAVDGGEIVFDLRGDEGHRRMGSDFFAYQNLTVKEAKKLRKALGKAIKAAEGAV